MVLGCFIRKLDVLYNYKNLNAGKTFDFKSREKIISDLISFVFKDDIGWKSVKSSELGNVMTDLIFNGFEAKSTSRYVFSTDDYKESEAEIEFSILNPQSNHYYICLKFADFIYVN